MARILATIAQAALKRPVEDGVPESHGPPRLYVVSLSESEFYQAGMALPPSVRREVALRLLESVEGPADEAVDEAWTGEIASRVDDIRSGRLQTIPGDEVFRRIDERLDAREAARNA